MISRLIKGSSVQNNTLYGHGYGLSVERHDAYHAPWSYAISTQKALKDEVGFVFGFTGVGCHYELTMSSRRRYLRLDAIQDGIRRYLHHVCLPLDQPLNIELVWWRSSIRVFWCEWCVINVYDATFRNGHWGWHGRTRAVDLPAVSAIPLEPEQRTENRILCLGDGFSNARWMNRHFVSWPEILGGKSRNWFNFCIAAANSQRVAQILQQISRDWGSNMWDKVFLAFGSDDWMEKVPLSDFLGRLKTIITHFSDCGAAVYVLGLPPMGFELPSLRQWNEEIRICVEGQGHYIDTFQPLLDKHLLAMQNATYPNHRGQVIIANCVAQAAELSINPAPFKTVEPFSVPWRVLKSPLYRTRKLCQYLLGQIQE